MSPGRTRIARSVEDHLTRFFAGHAIEYRRWTAGPIEAVVPGFRVAEIAPGPKTNLSTYVSIGAAATQHPGQGRYEFALLADRQCDRLVELLAMVAHRHTFDPIGYSHLLPLGEPWLPGATCDVFWVSRPYPFGEEFEICPLGEAHCHLAWLLPVTQAERAYAKQHGGEALEVAFDDAQLDYARIDRPSVV